MGLAHPGRRANYNCGEGAASPYPGLGLAYELMSSANESAHQDVPAADSIMFARS